MKKVLFTVLVVVMFSGASMAATKEIKIEKKEAKVEKKSCFMSLWYTNI